jgi:hypothetical protein
VIFSPVQFSNHTLPATLFRNNHSVFLATLTFSALKDLQEILLFFRFTAEPMENSAPHRGGRYQFQ